ncbi:MAG: hypothetical protein FWD81_01640, partial [Methanomassiliicoccaceae archaeon]|nr:hypothetical protein [Methanomassiliicoccaceae archaeon]
MQLIDFIDACNIGTKNDTDVFVLFCYYLMKENGSVSFSAKKMLHMYGDIGLAAPDAAVLKKDAALCGSFRPFGIEGTLRFTKDAMRSLEKSYGHLWTGVAAPKAAAVSASVTVRIADFVDAHGMTSRTDTENLELLCYYVTKEKRGKPFHIRSVLDMYDNAELDVSDRAALEKYAKKHPSFRTTGLDGSMEFVPTAFARLDALHGKMWMDADERPKGSTPDGCEIIDMNRFGGKRDGFDKLIAQINSSYRNEEFDSCALVMRRLLEAALIS